MPIPERPSAVSRPLAAVAAAGAGLGVVLGSALALGGGATDPAAPAVRHAFAGVAPDLRPRSTPSFDWALLLPRPPLRLASGARELQCLAEAVYYEARGEPAAGQAAVAQVVLNRTRRAGFPHTVCGVVFQKGGRGCQFSFVCDGAMGRRRDEAAWAGSRAVAARALGGYRLASVGGATHFHVAGLRAGWGEGLLQVARIGAHVFYGAGARPAPTRLQIGVRLTPAALSLPPSPAPPAAPAA